MEYKTNGNKCMRLYFSDVYEIQFRNASYKAHALIVKESWSSTYSIFTVDTAELNFVFALSFL